MTSGEPGASGDDALRRRVESKSSEARRTEALQTLCGWTWLEVLRLRFDLAIEVLGLDGEFVFEPLPDLHSASGLRGALQRIDQPLRETALSVAHSGKARALTAGEFRVRLVPLFLRSTGSPVPLGVLAVGLAAGAPPRPAPADAEQAADRRLDTAAQWLGAAIDASLAAALRQAGEARDLERAAGAFDVVGALMQLRTEHDIISLLMDAVALWYDADVYVYQQDVSGTFTLYASLPGVQIEAAAPQLMGHQIWGRGEVFHAESHGELEALGWPAAMGRTLFVPILVDQSAEWLLAVSEIGDDPAIAQTLEVFGRVAGGVLGDLQHQLVDRLARRLTTILLFGHAPLQATARMAFEAVAADTGASSVQFAAFDERGRPGKMLSLQWGGSDEDEAPFVDAETTSLTSRAIAVGIGTGGGATAVLSLKRDAGAFAPVAQRLARSAVATIGIWLSGSLLTARDLRAAESVEFGGELVQRLRTQVDRFGHVRVAGAVAVVLPQSAPSDGHGIDEAVDLIEQHVRPSDVIGAVPGAGAGVLLPEATRDVASAVVGRLLRAAKEKGLSAVRVGVAMFAASTESPESVLERAVMNARRGSAV